jgi:hypothetical protein
MVLDSTVRRRCLGALVLLAALGMLVLGQTVWKERLQGLGFVFYWMACVLLTGLAVLIALLDFRALVRRSLREQHDLLTSTLHKIEKDATTKPRR